jgi:hypothetical protein
MPANALREQIYRGWRDLVAESWPAITASELLSSSDDVWKEEGLGSPKEEEAIAFAAVGRLLRFGQSVQVTLPVSREPTLTRLAFYLHRLRLDAASGMIRSCWLNPVTIDQRNDLIVFGRPRRMLRDFSTSVVMRPTVVDGIREIESSKYEHVRTLLVSGHGDLLEILSSLAQKSQPFAIVVDATPAGCDENSINIIKVLPEFFRGVPVVALAYTGQIMFEELQMHAWNTRLGDVSPLRQKSNLATQSSLAIEVISARDHLMDNFLKKLGYMTWNLRRKMEETGGLSPELSALFKVERTLRSLNVPLPFLKQGTLRHLRGGRFAVRQIDAWLEIASRLKGRRGDIHELLSQILGLIKTMINDLEVAIPGRVDLIINICSEALSSNQRVSVLVGNHIDAEILQDYVEQRLGSEASGQIDVVKMDGSTAVAPATSDIAIYAGVLYPSRRHWLGLDAAIKFVLCHPFECQSVCEQVSLWWSRNAIPSPLIGDKHRLWSLEWPRIGHLRDLTGDMERFGDIKIKPRLFEIDGIYPKKSRIVELESTRGYEDWLTTLLFDPPVLSREDEVITEHSAKVVVAYLEGHSGPERWSANRQVMVLRGEDVEVRAAKDLVIGDEVVILGYSEDRVATQRDLFDMFVQNNHGLRQTLRTADKWQQFVNESVRKYGTAQELNRILKSNGLEVANGTVQNWVNQGVIGPQNPLAIKLFAQLAGIPDPDKMAKIVANAINSVRVEHRRIGVDLRRAVSISRNREVSAIQIGTRRFSREIFDEMVQISRIKSIERPWQQIASSPTPLSIRDVALEYAERYRGKILFTPRCDRSMKGSNYMDLSAFSKVLQVLIHGFYEMYANKNLSLRDVESMLRQIPATYAGGMSEISKGLSGKPYYANYQGQRVDLSRHIKLGRTFDPRYTLRLHFHWDAERSMIVVHHAGQHLPTWAN